VNFGKELGEDLYLLLHLFFFPFLFLIIRAHEHPKRKILDDAVSFFKTVFINGTGEFVL
jgi:hypothetical protein